MKAPIAIILILCCGQLNAHSDIFYYQDKQVSVINTNAQQHDFMRAKNTVFSDVVAKKIYIADGKNIAFTLEENTHATSMDYDPYGNSYTQALLGYNQTYQDPTTTLLYLRARDYAPSDERFISMDSYAVWNKYNFADANPHYEY